MLVDVYRSWERCTDPWVDQVATNPWVCYISSLLSLVANEEGVCSMTFIYMTPVTDFNLCLMNRRLYASIRWWGMRWGGSMVSYALQYPYRRITCRRQVQCQHVQQFSRQHKICRSLFVACRISCLNWALPCWSFIIVVRVIFAMASLNQAERDGLDKNFVFRFVL